MLFPIHPPKLTNFEETKSRKLQARQPIPPKAASSITIKIQKTQSKENVYCLLNFQASTFSGVRVLALTKNLVVKRKKKKKRKKGKKERNKND